MMGRLAYQEKVGEHEAGSFRSEGISQQELDRWQAGLTPKQLREQDQGKPWALKPRDTGMKNFFDYMQQIQPEIGKEMTGTFVQGISKYLGSTRLGVGNRAFGATLLMGEDMGTQAALGYRQAVKQLSGIEQTVQRSRTLAKMGLITGHMQGRAWVTDTMLDPALIARDLPGFLAKYLSPHKDEATGKVTKPEPLQKAEKLFKREFDATKVEDMQFLANKIVGNARAIDTVSMYLYNAPEIQRKLDMAEKRDPGAIRTLTQDSLNLTGQKLTNQFEGMFGSITKLFGPQLISAGESVSATLQYATDHMEKMRSEGKSQAEINKWVGTAGIAGAVGGYAASSVMSPIIGAAATPLAYAAGAQGMMSPNPAVRALSGAGFALTGAASALSNAAKLQQTAAVMNALGAMGMIGKAAAAGLGLWEMLPDDIKDKLTKDMKEKLGISEPSAEEKKQKLLDDQYKDAEDRRKKTQDALDRVNAGKLADGSDAKASDLRPHGRAPVSTDSVEQLKTKLLEEVNRLTVELDRLKQEGAKTEEPKPQETPPKSILPPALTGPSPIDQWLKDWFSKPRQMEVPPPEGKPEGAPIELPEIKIDGSLQESTATFASAVGEISGASASFASVFSSGASAIEGAGTSAIGAMMAGAGGVGAAIGAAAVGAISGASINVNVNANVTGGGASKGDTGGQTASAG
jgi:hypothetical protein